MRHLVHIAASAAAMLAIGACASVPNPELAQSQQTPAQQQTAKTDNNALSRLDCIQTGSRRGLRQDPQFIVTRRDLDLTGQTSLAPALSRAPRTIPPVSGFDGRADC